MPYQTRRLAQAMSNKPVKCAKSQAFSLVLVVVQLEETIQKIHSRGVWDQAMNTGGGAEWYLARGFTWSFPMIATSAAF